MVDELIERCWLTRIIKDEEAVREIAQSSLAAFSLSHPDAKFEEIQHCLERLAKDAELLAAVMERKSLQWSVYEREELMAIVDRLTTTSTSAAVEVSKLLASNDIPRRSLLECGGSPPL